MRDRDELRLRATWDGPPTSTGPIAIGDIHGRLDRLNRLLGTLPPDRKLVFLGDYIDRGPDSRGVIDRLLRLSRLRDCVLLCGNHEDMLLNALDGAYEGADSDWLRNGGDATQRSYRVSSLRRLAEELPEEHLAFLGGLHEHWET